MKADGFISVATDLAKVFEQKYPFTKGKISTLHNAVNVQALEKRANEQVELPKQVNQAILRKSPIIISIGRLEKQKRFSYFAS